MTNTQNAPQEIEPEELTEDEEAAAQAEADRDRNYYANYPDAC